MTATDNATAEIAELRARLAEAEDALAAIHSGAVDAFMGESGSLHQLPGAEKPYLTYFRAMGEGGVTLDSSGVVLHGNPRFAAMVGRPIDALRGASFLACVRAEDRNRVSQLLLGDASAAAEVSLVSAGAPLPVRLSLNVIEDGPQKFRCLVVTDLSERVRAEAELRIAAIAFESQDGIIVTDAEAVIVRVNQAFTRRTGYSAEEAIGRTPALLQSGRQSKAFYEAMWQSIIQSGYWQGAIWNRTRDGTIYAEWLTISAVTTPDRTTTHYVGTLSDIARNKEAEAEILRLAYYDPLTHLPNRRLLHDRTGQALASSRRSRKYGALLFLDLDHFKQLNDTRGHDVGDLLLIEVARLIRGAVREHDTVARLGGDEFVLMMEDLSTVASEAAGQARRTGEKILAALALPYDLSGLDFECSASLGVSLFSGHEESVEALFKQADLAMYEAKKAGRNTLRFFDPAMQSVPNDGGSTRSNPRPRVDRGQPRSRARKTETK